jgi:8-hydroxy-5-deazaflavin:NADPH oxidoreductase
MKLGFIGSGGVAQTLGKAFLANGHEVMLSSRSPEKLDEWQGSAGEKASAGTFEDAAKFGEVVFIATPGEAALDAISLAGKESFDGKTVIDLTNPLDFSQGTPPRFTATVGNSLGEQVQRALTRAHVVKAFNSIGAGVMIDPHFDGQAATLFIAGNDDGAKATVTKLAEEFGWEVADAGDIGQAFFLEAFASLWINYAFKHNQWNQAFKLLVR